MRSVVSLAADLAAVLAATNATVRAIPCRARTLRLRTDAGRVDTLTEGFERTAFTYNALGEMIEARGRLGTTLYVYDEAGHLLGEYDRRGGLIQETVWLRRHALYPRPESGL